MAKHSTWKLIRAKLSACSERDLLNLIGELYALNIANQNFLAARFKPTPGLDVTPYRKIIQQGVCPSPPRPFKLMPARKAIQHYKKATGDISGTVDLMVYYVECGNRFTLNYGDITESFYNSLEFMFAAAMKILQGLPEAEQACFLPRLTKLANETENIGWGYHDFLADTYLETFGKRNHDNMLTLKCSCHKNSI